MTPARRQPSCSCDGIGAAMRAKAASPAAMLPMLTRIASLLPTHTRRSEESESLQQFSTPIGLAFVASIAAAITPADRRAGAIGRHRPSCHPRRTRRRLPCPQRVRRDAAPAFSTSSFPASPTTRFDAAHINDHLDAGIVPSVVLMNPPFSAAVHVDRQMADAALRHVASALARLPRRRTAGRHHRRERRARQSRMDRLLHSAAGAAAGSCSRRRSTAPSMPSTAPASTRG